MLGEKIGNLKLSIPGYFITSHLGVILLSTLSFDSHILIITKKSFFHLKSTFKLCPSVNSTEILLQDYSPTSGPWFTSLPSSSSCIGSLSTTTFNSKFFSLSINHFIIWPHPIYQTSLLHTGNPALFVL